jgi:hypothetical protein
MEKIEPKLQAEINKSIQRHEIPKDKARFIQDWAEKTEWNHVVLVAVMLGDIEICDVKNGEPVLITAGSNFVG